MASNDPQTVLLTSDLGSVGRYDSTAPLARVVAKGSLQAGQLYLRATLDEMIRIRNFSKNLDENHHDLLRETRARYDEFVERGKEIESFKKVDWIFKFFQLRRAKRAYVDGTYELWQSTRTTSDRLKRSWLSTPTADLDPVESLSVANNERVSGLAVEVNGPVTPEVIGTLQEAASILASVNPFDDSLPSDDQGGQTQSEATINPILSIVNRSAELLGTGTGPETEVSSSAQGDTTLPNSPGSASSLNVLNFNINYNIVNNTDANTPGLTINNGSGLVGSSSRT